MLSNEPEFGKTDRREWTEGAGDGTLAALSFSDLYLEAGDSAWFKTYANDPVRHEIGYEQRDAIADLKRHLETTVNKNDFRLHWDGMSMRGARFETVAGPLYVLRRHAPAALPFNTLGYGKRVEDALLAPAMCGRVILISGGTSSGKTVGATSLTVEWMKRYGGVGYTIENPIEMDIEGVYRGDLATGTLYQKEVDDDTEFGPEIRRRQRGAPNVIMVGELRTADAVVQAFLAAASGVLVIATYHAADQVTGLQRLANMVRDAGADSGLFAHAIGAVIHQQLQLTERDGETHRELHVTPLIVAGSRNEKGIRSQLQGTDYRQLPTEADRQKRVMNSASSDVEF
ncbi:TPA: ATPase, T2SS/T4P/T4SS family [Burkholderia ambifaria]